MTTDLTGVPEHVRALLASADALPLRHRMGDATDTARRSAVLVLFGETERGHDVLLIEKSARLRTHAGQPAFPGGGAEPGEDYPVATALREAWEEAGVEPASVRVLGTLPELFLGPSDNLVVPVVGWWDDARQTVTGDPFEVAQVVRVPLAELVDPARRFRVRHPSGYTGPAFEVAGLVVWGFTAGVLDAVFTAAGVARPWDTRDVRDLAAEQERVLGTAEVAEDPADRVRSLGDDVEPCTGPGDRPGHHPGDGRRPRLEPRHLHRGAGPGPVDRHQHGQPADLHAAAGAGPERDDRDRAGHQPVRVHVPHRAGQVGTMVVTGPATFPTATG
ncbi:hypothetical protein GCM10023162_12330 [Klenkia terrae]